MSRWISSGDFLCIYGSVLCVLLGRVYKRVVLFVSFFSKVVKLIGRHLKRFSFTLGSVFSFRRK